MSPRLFADLLILGTFNKPQLQAHNTRLDQTLQDACGSILQAQSELAVACEEAQGAQALAQVYKADFTAAMAALAQADLGCRTANARAVMVTAELGVVRESLQQKDDQLVAARGEVQLLCAAEQRRVEEMAELNGQMERCRERLETQAEACAAMRLERDATGAQLTQAQQFAAELQQQMVAATAAKMAAEEALDSCRVAMAEGVRAADEEMAALQAKIKEMQAQKVEMEALLKGRGDTIDQITSELAMAREEAQGAEALAQAYKADFTAAMAALAQADLGCRAANARGVMVKAELGVVKELLQETNGQLVASRGEVQEALAAAQRREDEMAQLSGQIESCRAQLAAQAQACDIMRLERDSTGAHLAQAQQYVAEVEEQMAAAMAAKVAAEEALGSCKVAMAEGVRAADEEMAALQDKIKQMQASLAQADLGCKAANERAATITAELRAVRASKMALQLDVAALKKTKKTDLAAAQAQLMKERSKRHASQAAARKANGAARACAARAGKAAAEGRRLARLLLSAEARAEAAAAAASAAGAAAAGAAAELAVLQAEVAELRGLAEAAQAAAAGYEAQLAEASAASALLAQSVASGGGRRTLSSGGTPSEGARSWRASISRRGSGRSTGAAAEGADPRAPQESVGDILLRFFCFRPGAQIPGTEA
ncbi:hypothetical protein MNEG_6845 [Monoraphidium neglectum]|uniref:Uncharacterized protein n=1 Tax=Monoraphidium neglectum TaxID=145388 RepID=A0A0D2L189_9CHLO|nr:hypothetical protein MNEG_6845 [Monoraphidium neglectum]KIZ01114.1 hypothetical protein MNEG_6845 [Monoraphidium neglectum]|eukprot:XP_013900133.1 hypothetical protein MNEG_6845 [Monoraphidium neglectum]